MLKNLVKLICHYRIFFSQLVWYFIDLHDGKIINLIPIPFIKDVKKYSQTTIYIVLDKLYPSFINYVTILKQ